jgi:hypothetical protein
VKNCTCIDYITEVPYYPSLKTILAQKKFILRLLFLFHFIHIL